MVATCGGYDSDDYTLTSCLVLDPSTGHWEENKIGSLRERSYHAAVTLDKFVYILSGYSTELLRAGSSSWEQGPPIPLSMYSPCAIAISGERFLAIYRTEIREFDVGFDGPTSSQGWKEWPKMETKRVAWPGCAKIGNTVVVAGGWDGRTHQTTEILDLTTRGGRCLLFLNDAMF